MPTTASETKAHQARWNEIVRDPALQDLPYSRILPRTFLIRFPDPHPGSLTTSPKRPPRSRLLKYLSQDDRVGR
jgi:hypothetical protein